MSDRLDDRSIKRVVTRSAPPARKRLTAAKQTGELAADLDADDLAEAILVHLEGLFVIAKARNDPDVFERLPRDIGRLRASRP